MRYRGSRSRVRSPQSRLYCLCINVALCSTALRCICRVIRRSSMTMKAHTYYINFGRPPIGGKLLPFPPGGATACVGVCCTYRALALQQAGGGEATAGHCAGTSRHSSSSWQPSSISSSSRRRTMRRGPDGTPTATDERARRRLSTRQRHQQRSERRRTDLKANSHRHARHDTDTTVLSSLV